jgi:Lrp/AsnC family leucine-responsive transcriptional regulator
VNELGAKVGLSQSACWTRLKRLEANGAIQRYAAILDHKAIGLAQATDRYLPISWDEALAKIGAALRAVDRLARFWTSIPRLRPNDTQSTW